MPDRRTQHGSTGGGKPRAIRKKAKPVATLPENAPEPVPAPVDLIASIDKAIQALHGKLSESGAISTLIRLMQLRKELDEAQPSTVTVRWIKDWDENSGET